LHVAGEERLAGEQRKERLRPMARRAREDLEVAAQPPPGWLASKLLVANPSFSVDGGDWVPCSQSG